MPRSSPAASIPLTVGTPSEFARPRSRWRPRKHPGGSLACPGCLLLVSGGGGFLARCLEAQRGVRLDHHQALADRVADQFRVAAHAELLADVVLMRFHG